jgi:hypothetical protein
MAAVSIPFIFIAFNDKTQIVALRCLANKNKKLILN